MNQLDCKNFYDFIRKNIADLKSEILQTDHDDFMDINKNLNNLENKLKKEINELEKHTEQDRFIIAFYDETNAGKSTDL